MFFVSFFVWILTSTSDWFISRRTFKRFKKIYSAADFYLLIDFFIERTSNRIHFSPPIFTVDFTRADLVYFARTNWLTRALEKFRTLHRILTELNSTHRLSRRVDLFGLQFYWFSETFDWRTVRIGFFWTVQIFDSDFWFLGFFRFH